MRLLFIVAFDCGWFSFLFGRFPFLSFFCAVAQFFTVVINRFRKHASASGLFEFIIAVFGFRFAIAWWFEG